MQENTNELVERLVAVHGEEGVCPTASDWQAIFAVSGGQPLHILNLLKFREKVETPDGPIAGAEAYGKYSAGVSSAFAHVGGKRIFFGAVGHMFAFGDALDWDAAIVTQYPSAQALADMWLSEEFVTAHRNRLDGVARSQVLVF